MSRDADDGSPKLNSSDLGGALRGDRLNWIYKDMVPATEVATELEKVFTQFKAGRTEGETFGDFCDRVGKEALLEACA